MPILSKFLKIKKKQHDVDLSQMLTELHPDLDFALDATMPFLVEEDSHLSPLFENSTDSSIYFDIGRLKEQYTIENEITGGGMSRVFLAKRNATGNYWIIKFIPKRIGRLTSEVDILKSVNHTNLPTVIDAYEDEKGIYLVESYIEGIGLNEVFEQNRNNGKPASEYMVIDWALQLAQVLSYLHKRKPPIYHLDLKPSNIIVTPDNKLSLIDFGVSRQSSKIFGIKGITYSHAAPEQILSNKQTNKRKESIKKRFGILPENSSDWSTDERTDIYGLGVILFEAAFGDIPTFENIECLRNYVSKSMYDIITRCLAIDPINRYQSMDEIILDIQKQRQQNKLTMAQSSFRRKLVFGIVIFTCILSTIFIYLFANNWLFNHKESTAESVFFIYPDEAVNIIRVYSYQNEVYAVVRTINTMEYGIAYIADARTNVIYWAKDYAVIIDLAIHNGHIYFIENSNEGYEVNIRRIGLQNGHDAQTLSTHTGSIISIGVISNRIYIVDSLGMLSFEPYMD